MNRHLYSYRTLNRNLLTPCLLLLVGCGGGNDVTTGGGSANAGDPALIGMWTLFSRNGVRAGGATLTFTASTYRFEGPDCVETGTYTVSGGTLTVTVSTLTGSGGGCEEPPGQIWVASYTLTTITHAHPNQHSHPALVLQNDNTTVWIKI